jgi:hypothetical protein
MTALTRFFPRPAPVNHRPIWAVYHDHMTDLSDVYVEENDPENIIGALVTGFYTANEIPALDDQMRADFVTGFDLQGIAVETTEGTTYHDRAEVIRMWGMDVIDRVERSEMAARA